MEYIDIVAHRFYAVPRVAVELLVSLHMGPSESGC